MLVGVSYISRIKRGASNVRLDRAVEVGECHVLWNPNIGGIYGTSIIDTIWESNHYIFTRKNWNLFL